MVEAARASQPDNDGRWRTIMVDERLHIDRAMLITFCAITFVTNASHGQELPHAAFRQEPNLTTNEGHVALGWGAGRDSLVYELQSALEPDFIEPTRLYQGTDQTSFLSGLVDGQYYFRVRAKSPGDDTWGPWSESVDLMCEHHSLTLAWVLFASGGLLFGLIVFFVGVNARSLERFERADV
jgi:hypothetical protein